MGGVVGRDAWSPCLDDVTDHPRLPFISRVTTSPPERASHIAPPRSAFGGTVTYPIAMPPLTTATAKVHSADENQVGANNGGGIYRWPEFDSRAGVSRLQPYPRLAHASYSLRKATTPKSPIPLEPNDSTRLQ
jgi:hypothetical protein